MDRKMKMKEEERERARKQWERKNACALAVQRANDAHKWMKKKWKIHETLTTAIKQTKKNFSFI